MRTYQQVVRDRYDKDADSDANTTKNLQWLKPQLYLYKELFEVLKVAIQKGLNLGSARILEVGCGEGRWTRFIAEITKHPELIAGSDLSERRVEYARKFNPAIRYFVSDLAKDSIQGEYDLILAWDVFMHLGSREEISGALRQIGNALSPNGIFVFFDAWTESHFLAPPDNDSWGYNPKEIEEMAIEVGLKPFHSKEIFKVLPRLGHSEILYRNYPEWFVRSAERVLPGKPGNFFMLFCKQESETE